MSEQRPIGSFANQVKRINEACISKADVYSVTKYDGFVRSLDYFKKQVFSRDLSSYKIVKRGEFAYSTIHLDEGALGLLGDEEALISPMYTTFEVDESIDKIYLYYLLRSPELVSQYGLIGQGSVNRRKSVPFSSLAEIEVFAPPLPEQKKIAEILSGIDRNITIHLDMLQKLKVIHSGIFCEITKMKERANHVPLGQIISEITSGWSPTCSPATRTGERPAILKTTSITWEGYNPGENKILPAELQVKEEAVVRAGDILCTRKGPRERVGVVCYVEDTPPNLMIPDTAFRMRVNKGINPHFVSLVLSGQEIQEEWNRKKVGLAEAQVNINHGIINKTLIPIVPIEDQVRLTNAISGTRSAIRLQTAKINALRITKDALAADLLSGRKRVSV